MNESDPTSPWPFSGPSTWENQEGPEHHGDQTFQLIVDEQGNPQAIGVYPDVDPENPPRPS